MSTYASIYINGELLCCTKYDGDPYNLGESLKGVNSNWREILSACKWHGIYMITAKYFNKDPEFAFSCIHEIQQKRNFPDGLTSDFIQKIKAGYEHDVILQSSEFPNELYEAPPDWEGVYQYNHTKDMVFVRYDSKNFPWVLVVDPARQFDNFNDENNILIKIEANMCGSKKKWTNK
jgi:hypothetical protein